MNVMFLFSIKKKTLENSNNRAFEKDSSKKRNLSVVI